MFYKGYALSKSYQIRAGEKGTVVFFIGDFSIANILVSPTKLCLQIYKKRIVQIVDKDKTEIIKLYE